MRFMLEWHNLNLATLAYSFSLLQYLSDDAYLMSGITTKGWSGLVLKMHGALAGVATKTPGVVS